METFFKKNKTYLILFSVFTIGYIVGQLSPSFSELRSPTLIRYDGNKITIQDVDATLSEQERIGNNIEYKKQIARIMMKKNIVENLAKKDGITSAEYIKKIKNAANVELTEEEINKFLSERKFDRKTLSKAQFENIVANMKEQKREIFFTNHLNNVISSMKVISQ